MQKRAPSKAQLCQLFALTRGYHVRAEDGAANRSHGARTEEVAPLRRRAP